MQAKTWGQRPSEILHINPTWEYLCWCFDDAVLWFGVWVENKLSIRDKGKAVYSLAHILDDSYVEGVQKKSLAGLLAMTGSFAGVNE